MVANFGNLMLFVGFVLAFWGMSGMEEMATSVLFIGLAVFCVAVARVAQAQAHHDALMAAIEGESTPRREVDGVTSAG